jgi:mycothiol synthase
MAAIGEPPVTTVRRMEPRSWGPERLGEVVAVVDAALGAERLTDDELGTILFDDPDPAVVLGIDGVGVAAAVVRRPPQGPPAVHVQLVAVVPGEQRAGHGGALLRAVHRWAFDEHGAAAVVAGGGAPFCLWPGVDVHATGAQCLFESLGYEQERAYLGLTFPSRFRAPLPGGVDVRRVLTDADAETTLAFVARHWPHWVAECRRGIEHAACLVALAADVVVGFGCHSVNRLGVLGPIGTDPAWRGRGVGGAVMSAIATDVMAAGFEHVQVSWPGPYRFYAKAAGATTSRAYLRLVLRPPASPPA